MRISFKYSLTLIIIFFTVALTGQEASILLNEGIYEEEVNGNLDAAIEKYLEIITTYPNERLEAAHALLRLGITNEKKGNEKAKLYFLRLIKDYNDQTEFVIQAENRVKKLISLNKLDQEGNSGKEQSSSANLLKVNKEYFRGGPIKMISPDGRYLIYGAPLGNLAVYDRVEDETRLLTPDPDKKDAGRDITRAPKGIAQQPVWSPDSKKIAYLWVRRDEGDDLRIYNLLSNETNVLCPYDGKAIPVPIQWTEDGKYLMCKKKVESENAIQIILLDILNKQQYVIKEVPINSKRVVGLSASISPNGKYLIYSDINDMGKNNLFLLNIETGKEDKILDSPSTNEIYPLWLEDGKSFLYFSDRSKTNALWKASFTENMKIKKTEILVQSVGFIFTHVGITKENKYYYWSHVRILELYLASIDVESNIIKNADLIVKDDHVQRLSPSWSRDRQQIACVKIKDLQPACLEIIELRSGIKYEVPLNFNNDQRLSYQTPEWGVNDQKIFICVRTRSKKPASSIFSGVVFEILMIDLESNEITLIASDAQQPKIIDEKTICFRRDRSLIIKDLSSGNEQVIFNNDSLHIGVFNVSTNGKYIAFSTGSAKNLHLNDQIFIYSLADKEYKPVWKAEENMTFGELKWLDEDSHILVEYYSVKAQNQDYFKYNINTEIKEKIALSIPEPIPMLFGINLNHQESKIVFYIKKNNINLWSLENY